MALASSVAVALAAFFELDVCQTGWVGWCGSVIRMLNPHRHTLNNFLYKDSPNLIFCGPDTTVELKSTRYIRLLCLQPVRCTAADPMSAV